jgi:ankyrin repeat protein
MTKLTIASWQGCALALAALALAQAPNSSVARKSGGAVAGQIRGRIVLKLDLGTGAVYALWSGGDLEAVDGDGIHKKKGAKELVVICACEGACPGDVELLETVARNEPVETQTTLRLPGGTAVRMTLRLAPVRETTRGKALGEFRYDRTSGKGSLLPAIEVATPNGVVSVPVSDIGGRAPAAPAQGTPATLHEAAKRGDVGALAAVLAKTPDIDARDADGNTPLMYAAGNGNIRAVELLLAKGANVKGRGKEGCTALHSAAWKGYQEVCALLIDKGADPEDTGCSGASPLWMAASAGRKETVELLLAKGAKLTVMDSGGYTPLHEAAGGGHTEVVHLLLAKGADPNIQAKDARGLTPLHYAVLNGEREVVAALIAAGASPQAKGKDGSTPLAIAEKLGRAEIIALLKQAVK